MTEPESPPVPEEMPPVWNDADVLDPPVTPASSDPGATNRHLRDEVDREMRRHVKFLVVKDVFDSNGVATILSPSPGSLTEA